MDTSRNYPASTLSLIKGKWYVSVTIPADLRSVFNNRIQVKVSTGTSDKSEASKRQHQKAAAIYSQFDGARPNRLKEALIVLAAVATPTELLPQVMPEVADLLKTEDLETEAVVSQYLEAVKLQARQWEVTEIGPKFDAAQKFLKTLEEVEGQEAEGPAVPKFMDIAQDWMNKGDMAGSLLSNTRLAVGEFESIYPNLLIDKVRKIHLYDYADWLVEQGFANNTIKGRMSRLSKVFLQAEKKGHIEQSPTVGLNFRGYGRGVEHWKPFTKMQLSQIFAQDIPSRERLLMATLITTGMRLDEAALLEWDDYKTEGDIPYFDLTRTTMKIKTLGSRRMVPVVPVLRKMLRPSEGRIFDFRLNAQGKTSSASILCMDYIRSITQDPHLVNHSFRGTLKDLLRDAGAPAEVNNFITGHSSGDVAGKYGKGPSLKVRYDYLLKVDHEWLA
jgi:integrase